jgi:hypothetical protein
VLPARRDHPGTRDEARAVEVRDDQHEDHREQRPPHDLLSLVSTHDGEQPGDRKGDERADGQLAILDQ